MLKAIAAKLAKWKIRKEAQHAFADGAGVAGRRWPAARVQTVEARAALAEELCVWLRARIAQTATPYGISHCSVLFRLSDAEGKTVVWPYRSPAFERIRVAEGLEQVGQQMRALQLEAYPMAHAIEAYVISLGDIIRHAEAQHGRKQS
jgi:hypothetical protein